jgi:phosphate transport system substrate-binding protein
VKRRLHGWLAAPALIVCLGLVAAACGDSGGGDAGSGAPGDTTGGTPTTQVQLAAATLNGSGATFPRAFYEEVILAFKDAQPAVTVNYAGGGSGTGRQNLQDGVVDFAGSDGLVRADDVPKYKGEFLYVPTVVAPITVSYNLSGVDRLSLNADTIARIFQRQVTVWNDPAIAATNAGVSLPSTPIVVAHRSDGSGTTENFTKYLAAAAPNVWTRGSGSTVEWPTDTQAGNGNTGVAQIVQSTNGAIGYVDLADAKASGLKFASVINKAGQPVTPTLAATSAALDGVPVNADLTYNPLNADGATSYPISAPTWVLVYKNQTDRAKGEALKGFLTFMLTEGQELAEDVDYARLPVSLQQKALQKVNEIVVPAP